jgi:hypothetical protein
MDNKRGRKMSKHTPGPWGVWKTDYDDACLISAAPELLEACKKARHEILHQSPLAAIDAIESAIRKAEGGSYLDDPEYIDALNRECCPQNYEA